MDPVQIIRRLNVPDRIPVEAIHAAEADRPAAAAAFLDAIERYLSPDRDPVPSDALFFMFHLLGEWREKSAYRPLARLLHRPQEKTFGDLIETSHRVMAAVFDGAPEPLYEIILDPSVDEFVRSRMLETIAMVTRHGELPRSEAERFLRVCYTELEPQAENFAWDGWQSAIALIGASELAPLVEQAFARELISPSWLAFEDFESDLRRSIEHPTEPPNPGHGNFTPFGNTIEELSTWYCFSPQARADRERAAARRELRGSLSTPFTSVVNPRGKVGRNDPCSCGSGKKFKKCCLRADIAPAATVTESAQLF